MLLQQFNRNIIFEKKSTMIEILFKILPILLISIIGYLLKVFKIFTKDHADIFLKLVFYIAIPALILISFSNVQLHTKYALLPVSSAIIILTIYLISSLAGKLFKLPRQSFGTFLVGTMILNTGFLLPYIIAVYGDEGLARILIFDFSNGFLAYTFVYFIACKYGMNGYNKKHLLKKFIFATPFWGLTFGIIINLSDFKIPDIAYNLLEQLGNLTIPLLMLSIGIYFTPKAVKVFPMLTAILIRSGVGLLLGYFSVLIFGFEGLTKSIVLIASAAPIGFNTLTYASMEKLDKEFAASMVSYSILLGLIFIPVLIFILG